MDKIFESEQVPSYELTKKPQDFKIYTRYQFFKLFKKNISRVLDLIMNEFGSEEPRPERIISFLELIIHQTQHYCHYQQAEFIDTWITTILKKQPNKEMIDFYDDYISNLEDNDVGDEHDIDSLKSVIAHSKDNPDFLTPIEKLKTVLMEKDFKSPNDDIYKIMHALTGYELMLMKEMSRYQFWQWSNDTFEILRYFLPGVTSPLVPFVNKELDLDIINYEMHVEFKPDVVCNKPNDEDVHKLIHYMACLIYNVFIEAFHTIDLLKEFSKVELPEVDITKPLFYGDKYLIEKCSTEQQIRTYMYDKMLIQLQELILCDIRKQPIRVLRTIDRDTYWHLCTVLGKENMKKFTQMFVE